MARPPRPDAATQLENARPHARKGMESFLRKGRLMLAVGVLMALSAGVSLPGLAQQPQKSQKPQETPTLILNIGVVGVVQTTLGEILSNLSSRIGDALDSKLITRDIKVIYNLGFYQNVIAEVEEVAGKGYNLKFIVREKPRIVSIKVVGNQKVGKDKIFETITLQIGSFYTKALVDENLDKIRSVYRSNGYLKVSLIPIIKKRTEFVYELTLQIIESPRLYITEISVTGTRVFTELDIKRMLQSSEVDCFDWATDSGVFDEDKINQDLKIIVTSYLRKGYIRVFIDTPKITLIHNPEFSKIKVELKIIEGEQYFTGKMDLAGDILGEKQELLNLFQLKTGKPFDAILRNQDQFQLQEAYQERGYAFARIVPDIKIDDKTRIVDVTYQIKKNEKAYIGRIEFQGNSETRDYVLRREFQVRENELFNGKKLRLSQRNLMALGYFEPSLSIDRTQRPEENILDLATRVKETQTGTLQAQLSYSEQSGVTLGLSVSKGNFLGRGQTLRTKAQVSQRNVTKNFSVDFIDPHLFNGEFSSDSTFAARTVDDTSELERGQIKEIRIGQGFGYPIISVLRLNFSFSAVNRTFEDLDSEPVKLRTFTSALSYSTVNHPVFPTDGASVTFSVSQTGGEILGGTTEFRRYRLLYRNFTTLNESNSLIMMFRLRLGFLEKIGNNLIPPEERFRMGGINTLRGYRSNEVGGPYGRLEQNLNAVSRVALDAFGVPILNSQGSPVIERVDSRTLGLNESQLELLKGGGIVERLINLELLFPLAGSSVRGVVFYDAGQVNSESEQYGILNEVEPKFFDLNHSIGGGLRIITPLGVLRFEYGRKLNFRRGESPDEFEFTISTLF